MEFTAFFLSLISAENGILAAGWALAAFLGYRALVKKDAKETEDKKVETEHTKELADLRAKHAEELADLRIGHANEIVELRKAHDIRFNETEDELEDRIKELTDRLHSSNDAQIKLITDIADKRIEDIKSLNEDYNTLAESVRVAIEKLAQNVSRKR